MTNRLTRRGALGLMAGSALAVGTLGTTRAFAQAKTLRLSHNHAPASAVNNASVRFAELVAEYSNGEIAIEVFPASQLAGLRQAAEGIQIGTIDFTWADMGTLGSWRTELGFVSLPFLFSSGEHFNAFVTGEGGKVLTESLRTNLGIEALGFGNGGFRIVATRETPVRAPSDLQGLRIRVPEIPVYIGAFAAVGANPTPMAWAEVYTALQTGVIDAVENPAFSLLEGAMFEVAHHLSRTNHIMSDVNLLASGAMFSGLSDAQKEAMTRAGTEAVAEFNVVTTEQDQSNWNQLAEAMEAIDQPDRAAFQAAMAPVWDEFVARAGDDGQALIDLVLAARPA